MKNAIQMLLGERVIAFNPILADIAGDVKGGLFLSQCCFMGSRVTQDPEGWFYQTDEQWRETTRLARSEILRVRTKLNELGLVYFRVRGSPPKTFYRVNFERLEMMLLGLNHCSKNAQMQESPICEKVTDQSVRKSQIEVQETRTSKCKKVTDQSVKKSHSLRDLEESYEINKNITTSAEKEDGAVMTKGDARAAFSALAQQLANGKPVRVNLPLPAGDV